MAVAFRIDQSSPGAGEPDRSRHDLVEGEPIELVAIEPAPGPDVSYQWEIVDRAASSAALTSTTGATTTIEASTSRPFAFLVEMRAYVAGSFVGATRRLCGARTPLRGLRLPLFSETADPSSRLSAPRPAGSTDNAQYTSLAGQEAGPNWRGWVQFLYELVGAIESVEGGAGQNGDALSLRGVPIANDAPAPGEVLTFANGAWNASPVPASTVPSAAGDVTGALDATSVVRLRNRPLATDLPAAGQVLTYDTDNQWRAKTPAATASSVNLSGDVTGTAAAATVARLRGRDVATTAPSAGQVLTWSSGSSNWYPATPSYGSQTVGGDVSGTVSAMTVNALAGHKVSTAAPAAGQVLAWVEGSGTAAWTPQTPAGGGNVTGPGGATANALARFSGTSGALLANSGITVDNAGNVALPPNATVGGRDLSIDGGKLDGIEAGAQATSFARVQTALAGATAAVSLNNQRLTALLDPLNAQDAATKAWVLAALGGGGGGGGAVLLDGDVSGSSGANTIAKLHGVTIGSVETGTAGQVLALIDDGNGGLSFGMQTPATGSAPAWSLFQEYDFTAMATNTTIQVDGSTRYLEWFGQQATLTGNGTVGVEAGLGLVMSPQAGEETGFDWSRNDALTINFPVWLHWRGDVAIVYELVTVREAGGAYGSIVSGDVVGVHLGYNVGGPSDGYVYRFDDTFRGTQLAAQRCWSDAVAGTGYFQLVAGLRVGIGVLRSVPQDPEVVEPEKIGLLALDNGIVELHSVSDWPNDSAWAQQPDQWTSGGNGPALQTRANGESNMASYRYRSFGFHAGHLNTGLNRVVISRVQVYTR